jgi:hypothetical protein
MKHLVTCSLIILAAGVAGCDFATTPTAPATPAIASASQAGLDGDFPPITCEPVVRFEEWSLPRGTDESNLFVVENNLIVQKASLPSGEECALFLDDLRGVIQVENSHADSNVPELYIRSSKVMGNLLIRSDATVAFDYSLIYGNINCQPGGTVWFYNGAGPDPGDTHGNNTVYGQISPNCTVNIQPPPL